MCPDGRETAMVLLAAPHPRGGRHRRHGKNPPGALTGLSTGLETPCDVVSALRKETSLARPFAPKPGPDRCYSLKGSDFARSERHQSQSILVSFWSKRSGLIDRKCPFPVASTYEGMSS